MEKAFISRLFQDHQQAYRLPSPQLICDWLRGLLGMLFPELSTVRYDNERAFRQDFESYRLKLFNILDTMREQLPLPPDELEDRLLAQLPVLRARLLADAGAILAGDPAAVDLTEVIRTYPGFYAIAVYRIAHAFQELQTPLIPRVLSESAHSRTGIEIHPAARIGERFCIDHGTGVVIGETVEIGNDVKLYQGVTLGALSVLKEMAKTKRHPTIEDNVVIYAGATILGGETRIGQGSIIGGNTWIVKSVPAHSRIYYQNEKLHREVDTSNKTL